MKKVTKQKWIKALRSGKYTQGDGKLEDSMGRNCCLGVLCKITGNHKNRSMDRAFPNFGARDFIGLPRGTQIYLAELNDGAPQKGIKKHSFAEIADYIEKNIKAWDE